MGFPIGYLSGRDRFIGFGIDTPKPFLLDPTQYDGAVIYSNGLLYYSNGKTWIELLKVPIDQPTALVPTTAEEQLKLRLTAFISTEGYEHSETQFIVRNTNDFSGLVDNILPVGGIKTLADTGVPPRPQNLSFWKLSIDDIDKLGGFGAEYWWSGTYFAGAVSSRPSPPFKQLFPRQLQDPQPVTPTGETTGTLQIDSFDTAFINIFTYHDTELKVYQVSSSGNPGSLVGSITYSVNGSPNPKAANGLLDVGALPLEDGVEYFWKARHKARAINTGNAWVSGEVVESAWTSYRIFTPIPQTMVLVYDTTRSVGKTIFLPLGVIPTGKSLTIDWGDGNTSNLSSGVARWFPHTYTNGGEYTVRLAGSMNSFGDRIYETYSDSNKMLTKVLAIGSGLGITSLYHGFAGCSNLEFVPPVLPKADIASGYTGIKNIVGLFTGCTSLNVDLNDWDVSTVTSMASCFYNCKLFNSALDKWNVSKVEGVETFSRMFYGCESFDKNIDSWGVHLSSSGPKEVDLMFAGCIKYNQDMSSWNLNGVRTAAGMFVNCKAFNKPIGNFDLSGVINTSQMFDGAKLFNRDISKWNVSGIQNMSYMFRDAASFSQDLSEWDVGSCTNFAFMFDVWNLALEERNRPFTTNVSDWQIGANVIDNVVNMAGMFRSRRTFNTPLSSWNISKVTNLSEMLRGCISFNQNISAWNTSNATNMSYLLDGCTAFNQPIGISPTWKFDSISGSGSIIYMLLNCSNFNQPIAWNFNHPGITTLQGLFQGCSKLGGIPDGGTVKQIINAGYFLNPVDTRFAKYATNLYAMFNSCLQFNEDLSLWALTPNSNALKTVPITNISYLFGYCSAFTNGANAGNGINGWDTSEVTTTHGLFINNSVFNRPLDNWNMRKVTDAHAMFYGCTLFNQPLNGPNWVLEKCSIISTIFYLASNFNQNITKWYSGLGATSPLTNMDSAFRNTIFNNGGLINSGGTGLNSTDIPPAAGTLPLTWDVPILIDVQRAFMDNLQFNQNLDNFATAPLKRAERMFYRAHRFNNGDIGGSSTRPFMLNVELVSVLSNQFQSALWFNQSIDNWNPIACTDFSSFLENAFRFNKPMSVFGSRFNLTELISLKLMLKDARAFNQPLNTWRTNGVFTLESFLFNAKTFDQSLAAFNVTKVANMTNMLGNNGVTYAPKLSNANYGATLNTWVTQNVQTNVPANFGLSVLNSADTPSRAQLVNNKRWTIVDGSGTFIPPALPVS